MKIKKIEDEKKLKQQTKVHRLPIELTNAVIALDNWLNSNDEFQGDLEWSRSFENEIKKEIARRNAKPQNKMGEMKIKLSKETLEDMRECDKSYAEKGYSNDWSSVQAAILKKLIKQNTKGLADVFKTEPPAALAEFYKEQSSEVKTEANVSSYQSKSVSEYQEEIEMEEETETV